MALPKAVTASLLIAFGLVAGVGISEWQHSKQPEQEPQKQEVVERQEGKQIVKTIFVGNGYDNGWAEIVPYKNPIHTAEVTGNFSPAEAYRYNIVVSKYHAADKNQLVSFTSPTDLTAGMTGRYTTYTLQVPSVATVKFLTEIALATRSDLKAAFDAMDAKENIGPLPTGLADRAQYKPAGYDGYAFKFWDDSTNGNHGYRDVTGVYPEGAGAPSTKVLTEAVINADGRVCRINGDAHADYEEWKQFKYDCLRIEKMQPAALQALKDKGAAHGMPLLDETIHTFVRGTDGKVVAKDVTQTLALGPVRMTEESWKLPDNPKIITAAALDTYVFMDLNAKGNVARVIEASFPKGSFAAGVTPEVKATGEFEYSRPDAYGQMGRPVYDVGGRKVLADTDPTGYSIRYVNDRFTAHGTPSKLPRNQRNQFGA